MSEENERIAVLESEVGNLKFLLEKLDKRTTAIERQCWIGFGIVVALQFILK